MIQVVVGSWKTAATFVMHEPLLRASSTYLTTKLDLASENGDDLDILELPADSSKIFGLINRYLYTGSIPSQDWQYLVPFPLHPLCDVWLVAYDLGMSRLVNYATWCLLKRIDEKRTYEVATTLPGNIEIIYEHTPAGSKLRKLLLDMCIWEFEHFAPSSRAPNRMRWDLFEALRQKQKAEKSPLLDVRNYYTTEEEIVSEEAKVEPIPTSPALELPTAGPASGAKTVVLLTASKDIPPSFNSDTKTRATMERSAESQSRPVLTPKPLIPCEPPRGPFVRLPPSDPQPKSPSPMYQGETVAEPSNADLNGKPPRFLKAVGSAVSFIPRLTPLRASLVVLTPWPIPQTLLLALPTSLLRPHRRKRPAL